MERRRLRRQLRRSQLLSARRAPPTRLVTTFQGAATQRMNLAHHTNSWTRLSRQCSQFRVNVYSRMLATLCQKSLIRHDRAVYGEELKCFAKLSTSFIFLQPFWSPAAGNVYRHFRDDDQLRLHHRRHFGRRRCCRDVGKGGRSQPNIRRPNVAVGRRKLPGNVPR